MLSVESRGEGRSGLSARRMIESRDDINLFMDPDTLSYIDERIEHLLGHLREEFDQDVSAENLGPKFGGYGTFLPSYQRSPPRVINHNAARPTCNSLFEDAHQNPSVLTGTSVYKNSSAPTLQSVDKSAKTSATGFSAGEPVPRHDSVNKPTSGSDQKAVKVRIKVGPDSTLARNNAAIYSGLGLDSPSSAEGESSDGGGEHSPVSGHAPDESPRTILQIMTSPLGVHLLSPLPESVLQLTQTELVLFKNRTGVLQQCKEEKCDDTVVPSKNIEDFIEKKRKPDEKRIMKAHKSNSNDDMSVLKREIDNETPEGRRLVSEALNISILSGSRSVDLEIEKQAVDDSASLTSELPDVKKYSNRIPGKDPIRSPDVDQDCKLDTTKRTNSTTNCLVNVITYLKGKTNPDITTAKKLPEGRIRDTAHGRWKEGRIKTETSYGRTKSDSAENATSHEQEVENILRRKDQLSEGKRKLNGRLANVQPALVLTKEAIPTVSSLTSNEKKKRSIGRCDRSEEHSEELISGKDVSKGHNRDSRRVIRSNVKPKTDNANLGQTKRPSAFTENLADRTGSKKLESPSAPLMPNAVSSDAFGAPAEPRIINENWVACDLCQKWRLLPYETDAAQFEGKKWQCSMQIWLTGLNKCDISEAVTTKALNALYQIPAPASDMNLDLRQEDRVLAVTSADLQHSDQVLGGITDRVPTGVKKKHGLKKESDVPTSPEKTIRDVKDPPGKKLSKRFSVSSRSKSTSYASEKQNSNQKGRLKVAGRYSDGGDLIVNNDRNTKLKCNGVGDHDDIRSFKKFKKDVVVEDWDSNLEVADDFPSKAIVKKLQIMDKFSDTRKSSGSDSVTNTSLPIPRSSKRCSDFEIDGSNDRTGKKRKDTSSGQAGNVIHMKSGSHGDHSPLLFKDRNVGCGSENADADIGGLKVSDCSTKSKVGRKDGSSSNGENKNTSASSRLPKQKKGIALGAGGASCSVFSNQENFQEVPVQRDMKSLSQSLPNRVTSGRGKSRFVSPSKDNHGVHTPGPRVTPIHSNGCHDVSKIVKQSEKPESQKAARQGYPNNLDALSPMRKGNNSEAATALKEARALKHSANRLKNAGLELESTHIYFDAALEFLHVASLWEPSALENTKQGDAVQSMQMFSDTARLFEFCANVYERCEQMASAALAYKCVEVAYMKVAYHKHPGASRDRHELQTALQMNSPSSSTSDVDNLNNHGVLDKAASAKGIASPRVAGNHIIANRSHCNIVRVLGYVNDLNSAFEATRKSHNAMAAASANSEKDVDGHLSTVKDVVDVNFHNVEGLLRLVRLSIKAIRSLKTEVASTPVII